MNEKNFNLKLKKNMMINYLTKISAIILTFFNIRILIAFLGIENYGVWTTLLSVVSWVSIGDFGIGNGLRNKLCESIAIGNSKRSREYISTAYYYLIIIATIIMIGGLTVLIYMKIFLNLNLNKFFVLIIMIIGISINFVLNIIGAILFANNDSGQVGLTNLFYNIMYCLLIIIFNFFGLSNISLILVSISYVISLISANLYTSIRFYSKNKDLVPNKKFINKELNKDIIGIGFKFFILQIAGIILFSTDNIIISKIINFETVTYYDLITKIYNNVNNFYSILLIPIWSATTYALTHERYDWIKKTNIKLNLLIIPFAIGLLILSFLLNYIIHVWIGKPIVYDQFTIFIFASYSLVGAWLGIYCSLLNGMGKVDLQMYLAILGAIINIPLSIYFAKNLGMGMIGVKIATFSTQILQAIILPIQYYRLMYIRKECKDECNTFDN